MTDERKRIVRTAYDRIASRYAEWSGRIADEALTEISGLARSGHDPRRLWVHNDSEGSPQLYGLGSDGRLRAEIPLPAGAPTGVYRADILLFQDGKPVSRRVRTLTVEKVGIERALYVWAYNRPWSYGLAAMAFALAAGWAASAAFRRD